jgi:acyl-CoA thioester hydrolase
MGIAHHSNYIVWFEIGRTDLCRLTGFPYAEIEKLGFLLVVTEVGCRYRTPYRYDDGVLIRTSVAAAGSRMMRFTYELLNETGTIVHASGHSTHLWLNKETRKPVSAPVAVIEAWRRWLPSGK